MENLEFKKFDKKYFNEVCTIYFETFNQSPWNDEWSQDQVEKFLSDVINTPGFIGFLLFQDKNLIGLCLGRVVQWWRGNDFWLESMCIHPAKQRNGFGSVFIKMVKQSLLEAGIVHTTLLTDRDMPSFDFFKKNGFDADDMAVCMATFNKG